MKGGSLSEVIKHEDEVIKLYRGPHERGYHKLRSEVAYIQVLPLEIKGYYPAILEVIDTPELYAYKMPFYSDMRSLSDEMFSVTDVQSIWTKLIKIIEFMNKSHYPQISTTDGVEVYIKKIIHDRLDQSNEALRAIKEVENIIDGGRTLNGARLLPLKDIISALRVDNFTNKILRPKELNLFHGNFHMDNMLVNDDSFILIDPRGESVGSKMYDVCKLFVHMIVRYDEIHIDRFKLNEYDGNIAVVLLDTKTGSSYDYIQQRYLEKCVAEFDKDYFSKCLMIIGGVHAISFASYHARKPDPSYNRVKAYLAAGMLLLTSYLDNQEVDLSKALLPYVVSDTTKDNL